MDQLFTFLWSFFLHKRNNQKTLWVNHLKRMNENKKGNKGNKGRK